jgi:hypothetical protein
VIRSGVGAFWPGACLLEALLLPRFPDLLLEVLAPVDLPAVDFPLETALVLLEAVRCLEDFAALGLAAELLLDEVFEDVEPAAE